MHTQTLHFTSHTASPTTEAELLSHTDCIWLAVNSIQFISFHFKHKLKQNRWSIQLSTVEHNNKFERDMFLMCAPSLLGPTKCHCGVHLLLHFILSLSLTLSLSPSLSLLLHVWQLICHRGTQTHTCIHYKSTMYLCFTCFEPPNVIQINRSKQQSSHPFIIYFLLTYKIVHKTKQAM